MPSRSYQDAGYSKYRWGFNGKEDDEDIGGGVSDFDARLLNKKTGRWMAVDPLAGKYPSLSPYNFTANNPISFIDPDGRKIEWAVDDPKVESYLRGLIEDLKQKSEIFALLSVSSLTIFCYEKPFFALLLAR
jgi:RHS repeat-associated protein